MLAALRWALKNDDSREATRLRVQLPVLIGDSRIPVTIVNISNVGAKIASDVAPMPDQTIDILWHDKLIPAQVHWSKSRHFGIVFTPRLSNHQLMAMVSDGLDL